MHVLITGATGLIGGEIIELCQNRNIAVNFLTTSADKLNSIENASGFLWDPKKKQIDAAAFKNVDSIIHLAGASVSKRWTDEYKKEIISSRVETAALLYDTLLNIDHTVEHFISASGISAYPSSYTKIYDEKFPDYHKGFLGKVVKVWEEAAAKFSKQGISVSKIRIGVVMANEGGALPQITKPIKFYVGAPLGNGQQWQSWIHVEDLAGIFIHILENRLEGVYNGVAPFPVTNETMTKEAAKIMNRPLWLPNVPSFVLKAMLGEMATIALESQKVSSAKIEEAGYSFQYQHLHEALNDLLA